MFRANLLGTLKAVSGRDVHGRPIFSEERVIPFSPVSLAVVDQKTSVRADSSASRGSADERATKAAKILVSPLIEISPGDYFHFRNVSYRIIGFHPRYAVSGQIDHFECDMEVVP